MTEVSVSVPPRWKACLWLLLLLLSLVVLLGAVVGAIEFIRWRDLW